MIWVNKSHETTTIYNTSTQNKTKQQKCVYIFLGCNDWHSMDDVMPLCMHYWHFMRECTEYRHDDVIKWKHFPRYWPFVWGIHWSSVNPLHKGQWRGALMFSLICDWINGVNNREAGDLRRHCAHCDVIVMVMWRFDIYFVFFVSLKLLNKQSSFWWFETP